MAQAITDQYPQWTQRIAERWEHTCKIILIRYPDIAALLCNASPVAVIGKDKEFVLFVQVGHPSHLEQLSAPASFQVVEDMFQRLYDQVTIYVRFIGKDDEQSSLETGTTPSTRLASQPLQASAPLQAILEQWGYVQRACKLKSPMAATLLSEATPKAIISAGTRELVVEVASEVTCQKLSKSPYRGIVEWALHAVIGISYRLHPLQTGEPLPTQEVQEISDLQRLINEWDHIRNICKRDSHKIAALLNGAKPVAVIGAKKREAVLRVEYEFHHKKLSEPANRRVIEQALEEVFGTPYRVRLIRKDDPMPAS